MEICSINCLKITKILENTCKGLHQIQFRIGISALLPSLKCLRTTLDILNYFVVSYNLVELGVLTG